MERTNAPLRMMDAINGAPTCQFTMVPTALMRDKTVTSTAKIVLTLLLGNKTGWHSCVSSIREMVADSEEKVNKALRELEELGYLIRIAYRRKDNKRRVGSFWAYTYSPFIFDIAGHIAYVDSIGLEIVPSELTARCNLTKNKTLAPHQPPHTLSDTQIDLQPRFPHPGKLDPGKRGANYIYSNNTKGKQTNYSSCEESEEEDKDSITPSKFKDFWELYPRKAEKGGALTSWRKTCNKPKKDRPTWSQIKQAIKAQKTSERWKNPKFIPLPTTWLNQSRWLDEPSEMKAYTRDEKINTPSNGSLYGKTLKEREESINLLFENPAKPTIYLHQ